MSPWPDATGHTGAMRSSPRQTLVTLDLEGVLVPEIWIAVAERTGIDALRRTTRDEPDYDVLMRYRLRILDEHGIGLDQISQVIGSLSPLEGAKDFLDELRRHMQVIILSDTFEQFAAPLMHHLDYPTVMCHRLEIDHDRIIGYQLRQADQKRHAVEAFQSLNYRVIAAGDSYNDVSMLKAADRGILFRAPEKVRDEYSELPACETYADLMAKILEEP